MNKQLDVNEQLFEEKEERELYSRFSIINFNQSVGHSNNPYVDLLDELIALKPQLDNFFDNVFVNHENEAIKTNRKNLIGLVYQGFKNIADIKEITI